jgi:uncharacterized protein (UPF0335 family)
MTEQNIKYDGNGSAEALRAFASRLETLVDQHKAIGTDIAALKEEINSAGFSHRALKKIVSAKIAADNGKPKPMADLREESGDLPMYLDILAPEESPADAA